MIKNFPCFEETFKTLSFTSDQHIRNEIDNFLNLIDNVKSQNRPLFIIEKLSTSLITLLRNSAKLDDKLKCKLVKLNSTLTLCKIAELGIKNRHKDCSRFIKCRVSLHHCI